MAIAFGYRRTSEIGHSPCLEEELHELMHLREMNHSERFWALVEAVCPRWREAERWLKNHGGALGL